MHDKLLFHKLATVALIFSTQNVDFTNAKTGQQNTFLYYFCGVYFLEHFYFVC